MSCSLTALQLLTVKSLGHGQDQSISVLGPHHLSFSITFHDLFVRLGSVEEHKEQDVCVEDDKETFCC